MKDLENQNLTELESPTPESVIAEGAKDGLDKRNKKSNEESKNGSAPEMDEKPPVERPQMALDDAARIKVLSPSMLVFKRFIRNKLAIVGCFILLFMFAFTFLGGWIIPYRQEEVFFEFDEILFDYATANERTSYENYYVIDKDNIYNTLRSMTNSYITEMEIKNETSKTITDANGKTYILSKLGENLFAMDTNFSEDIASFVLEKQLTTFNSLSITLGTTEDLGIINIEGFKTALSNAVSTLRLTYEGRNFILQASGTKNNYNVIETFTSPQITYVDENLGSLFENKLAESYDQQSFSVGDNTYLITEDDGLYTVALDLGRTLAYYATTFVFDTYTPGLALNDNFKYEVYKSLYSSESFVYDEVNYTITQEDKGFIIKKTVDDTLVPFANVSTFVARRYNGEDTLSVDFKKQLQDKIDLMITNGITEGEFIYYMQLLDEEGNGQVDEFGNPVMGEAVFEIERKLENFVLRNYQTKYLIDIYGAPSSEHLLGTDSNGMDVLTRIMFGGRISLMIGFIVIFIELIIGVVLGGIAGYFGKWIDNLLMRLVDIFNCIPSMPILIIMGAFFDSIQMDSYTRIMYLMIVLGILGWPGIARLVRGQILSLREQEFMIAAEASGLTANRRIFKHLIPNVMPQLIVNATMGLGGIILTESTLSFLGLGAKFPLATWGAIINSVSNASAMVKYTYIWIPVGLLICLTVIAFNFVGDGLRDAFDPKMKR